MGNCFGRPATVPSVPHPGPQVTELRPSAPAPLQRTTKEEYSIPPSSQTPSRRRSHSSAAKRQSTHHSGGVPQGPIPRSRTKSAPQPPLTFNVPSSQDPRPRARSVVQHKKSSHGPGETIFGSGLRISIDRLKRANKVRSSFTDFELPWPQSTQLDSETSSH